MWPIWLFQAEGKTFCERNTEDSDKMRSTDWQGLGNDALWDPIFSPSLRLEVRDC